MEIIPKNQINCCFCNKDLSTPSCQSVGEQTKIVINKYKCPSCERLYCSANCSSGHKDKFDCSGTRDRTPYVHLSKFDQKQFLDDYFFLEEVNKKIETAHRKLPELKVNKKGGNQSNGDTNHKKRYFKRKNKNNRNKTKS